VPVDVVAKQRGGAATISNHCVTHLRVLELVSWLGPLALLGL
jgi:hypothetical protein